MKCVEVTRGAMAEKECEVCKGGGNKLLRFAVADFDAVPVELGDHLVSFAADASVRLGDDLLEFVAVLEYVR